VAQFGVGLKEAAHNLGVCATTLKRACRRNGITRWPRRQIAKLNRALTQMGYSGSHPPGAAGPPGSAGGGASQGGPGAPFLPGMLPLPQQQAGGQRSAAAAIPIPGVGPFGGGLGVGRGPVSSLPALLGAGGSSHSLAGSLAAPSDPAAGGGSANSRGPLGYQAQSLPHHNSSSLLGGPGDAGSYPGLGLGFLSTQNTPGGFGGPAPPCPGPGLQQVREEGRRVGRWGLVHQGWETHTEGWEKSRRGGRWGLVHA
jgi:hypothetical protein